MTAEYIITRVDGRVGIIQFNRPKFLNALNQGLMSETAAAAEAYDANPDIGCIVITGNERAFAAGADIKEMADATPAGMLQDSTVREGISRIQTFCCARYKGGKH